MRTIVATPEPERAGLRLFRSTTTAAAGASATVYFNVDLPYTTTLPTPGAAAAPVTVTWKA